MTFLHPEFLYWMLPSVTVLFYFILTQKEPVAQFFDEAMFKRLRADEKRLSLRQRNALYFAVFVLLVVAMAQPVVEEGEMAVETPARPLFIAIDISASMRANDVYPDRLEAAKRKAAALAEAADEERIGVLAFGKNVYLVAAPNTDTEATAALIRGLDTAKLAEPGTDMMGAISAAATLAGKEKHSSLVLIGDGGDAPDYRREAACAKAHGLRIFFLAVATEAGAKIPGTDAVSRLNPAAAALAEHTGGIAVRSRTGTADVGALLHAVRARSAWKRAGEKKVQRYGQLFILPLGAALFLLLLALSSMSKRETVAVPSAVLLAVCLHLVSSLHADMLDYELLELAKKSAAAGDYRRAANAYYRYARNNGDDIAAMYDSACALYRLGDYAGAAKIWGRLHAPDRLMQYRILHNLGNALAMRGDVSGLKAAIAAYERALRYENDRETRENLEWARGRLMRLMRRGSPSGGAAAGQSGTAVSVSTPLKHRHSVKPAARTVVPASAATGVSDYETARIRRRLERTGKTMLFRLTPPQRSDSAHPW